MNRIVTYWNDNLYNNYQEGTNGIYNYLNERSIPLEFADTFNYGYSSSDGDKEFLRNTYTEDDLVRLGLYVQNSEGYYYFLFRDRLMIPIKNHKGVFVGFSARQIGGFNKNNGGKYVNSPASNLFNKSKLLYGFSQSKEFIVKQGYAIIVEGNIDRDRMFASGIKNVIATCGTAITECHLESLFLLCKSVYLLMDGDKAGRKSAQRCVDLSHEKFPKYTKRIKCAFLPEGQDPDLFILNATQGNDLRLVMLKVKLLLKDAKILPKTKEEKPVYTTPEITTTVFDKRFNNFDEIKNFVNQFNIVDIISRHGVELRRTGTNYKAKCPFHEEKTASFVVSESKQIFNCFGCGVKGGVLQFLQKFNHWTIKESLGYLKSL